jgi:hypothetical protein
VLRYEPGLISGGGIMPPRAAGTRNEFVRVRGTEGGFHMYIQEQ